MPILFRQTRIGLHGRPFTLWNVLKGVMPLVSPRRLLPEYLPRYRYTQMRRHDVKPRRTGWVGVNGRTAISWDEKFRLDLWYVDNRPRWLHMTILWLTGWQAQARLAEL